MQKNKNKLPPRSIRWSSSHTQATCCPARNVIFFSFFSLPKTTTGSLFVLCARVHEVTRAPSIRIIYCCVYLHNESPVLVAVKTTKCNIMCK